MRRKRIDMRLDDGAGADHSNRLCEGGKKSVRRLPSQGRRPLARETMWPVFGTARQYRSLQKRLWI